MKVRKPSLLTRLIRQVTDVQKRRDSNYNEYMNDFIGYDEYLSLEISLAIKEKNLSFKIENVKLGKPELGYGLDIETFYTDKTIDL